MLSGVIFLKLEVRQTKYEHLSSIQDWTKNALYKSHEIPGSECFSFSWNGVIVFHLHSHHSKQLTSSTSNSYTNDEHLNLGEKEDLECHTIEINLQ